MAITAHALALKTGKGVIHFFDPGNCTHDIPIAHENRALLQQLLATRRPQSAPSSGEHRTLYADNGRAVTVTEATSSAVHTGSLPEATPNSVEKASDPSKLTARETLSIGSSRRDSSVESDPVASSMTSVNSSTTRPITSEDISNIVCRITCCANYSNLSNRQIRS